MAEVQRHGFDFENWVIRTFFVPSAAGYTQKWNVNPEHNQLEIIPVAMRHLPVSIKTCKHGSPIGFGDALRQFSLSEDFLLIVGFWRQNGGYKNFVAVEAVKVTASHWKSLFAPISIEVLLQLDRIIKDPTTPYTTARLAAKNAKKSLPFTDAEIVLNPKIDSKTQRRLQCSLGYNTFWRMAGKVPYSDVQCALFGKSVPNPFSSEPRTFRKIL